MKVERLREEVEHLLLNVEDCTAKGELLQRNVERIALKVESPP